MAEAKMDTTDGTPEASPAPAPAPAPTPTTDKPAADDKADTGAGAGAGAGAGTGAAGRTPTSDFVRTGRKAKVALVVGYTGTGYQGLQYQSHLSPDATIEGMVFGAILKMGGTYEKSHADMPKVQFMRCARTDKGVHAASNVLSLKLILLDGKSLDELRDMINAHLPPTIRVHDIIPTTGSFHAKNNCTGRVYEYLLPTFMMNKHDKGEPNTYAKLKSMGPMPEAVRVRMGLPHEPDTYQTGESLARALSEGYRRKAFTERRKQRYAYRVDDEALARFRAAMAAYVGTKVYHNFSPRMIPGDPTSKRYIMSIKVCDPIIQRGMQFVRIVIMGQSFILNQIRMMVGAAIDVARGRLAPETHASLLTPDVFMSVPMAPPTGLFLGKPLFAVYDKKAVKHGRLPLNFEDGVLGRRIKDFREKVVWEHVIDRSLEHDDCPFEAWLRDLDTFTYRSKSTDIPQAVRDKKYKKRIATKNTRSEHRRPRNEEKQAKEEDGAQKSDWKEDGTKKRRVEEEKKEDDAAE